MVEDDQDRNGDGNYPYRRPWSTNKDRRVAVVMVVYMAVDNQDRNVDCSCDCSRPRLTDKDRRVAVVLVVNMIVDDQDHNVDCTVFVDDLGQLTKIVVLQLSSLSTL